MESEAEMNNREIKFRAYDEEMEEYFYSDKPDDIHFFEFKDGKLTGFAIREPKQGSDPMEPPEPYCDEYPVEQFTGLHDKNAWEGDRITFIPKDCSTKIPQKAVVIYSERRACFIANSDAWFIPLHECRNIEIIGNIHTEEKP